MRLSYPTHIKIIKLPCTGKIDVVYLLKTFLSGADGVYVAGCMEGDCHYLTGNLRARKRVEYAKKILDEVGIGGERLEMYNMSAAFTFIFLRVLRALCGESLTK
jgi:coenzyme F420-reducing hydrogenase delta subunit